jgi:hypothetical protein
MHTVNFLFLALSLAHTFITSIKGNCQFSFSVRRQLLLNGALDGRGERFLSLRPFKPQEIRVYPEDSKSKRMRFMIQTAS